MKFKEKRTLSAYNLRALCIEENWYTHGDNEEYTNLFSKLRENRLSAEITTDKIYEIAQDIWEHSNIEDYSIEGVMYLIAKKCDTAFFEI